MLALWTPRSVIPHTSTSRGHCTALHSALTHQNLFSALFVALSKLQVIQFSDTVVCSGAMWCELVHVEGMEEAAMKKFHRAVALEPTSARSYSMIGRGHVAYKE